MAAQAIPIRETVVDGVNGFLCDRDPAALAHAMNRLLTDPALSASQGDAGHGHAHDEAEPRRKLDLEVEITDAGPCKKHLKVAIAKAEVDRQFAESLGDLRKEAQVPGFRPGRAPKTLVERRFKKQVAGQVKQALLMTCLEQLDEDATAFRALMTAYRLPRQTGEEQAAAKRRSRPPPGGPRRCHWTSQPPRPR